MKHVKPHGSPNDLNILHSYVALKPIMEQCDLGITELLIFVLNHPGVNIVITLKEDLYRM